MMEHRMQKSKVFSVQFVAEFESLHGDQVMCWLRGTRATLSAAKRTYLSNQ
jgi:hypothetical protein